MTGKPAGKPRGLRTSLTARSDGIDNWITSKPKQTKRSPGYEDAAGWLAVSGSAVKSMIHRLRQRHRELVRDEIAQTVTTASEIDEELRHLMAVISE